ncbi:MAG: TolC family protein [Deltaproteobacteria bacterium]|nr:TolC family protein [Deltaproteobacteria bacterium]
MRSVHTFRFHLFLFVSLLMLSFPPMSFAEGLQLSALLKEAREKNPELKAIEEKITAREAAARAEGALDDPTLKVELEDLSREHPLNISPGNAMLTRYTISQMLPFPGKLSLRRKIAYKEALAAHAELKAKELEIISGIKEAYFDYAFLMESLKRTAEIKDVLSYMSKVAETRYSTGQVSQQDVIKVNVEKTMLSNELITLEAEKAIAASRLKSFIARPQSEAIDEPQVLSRERIAFDTEMLIKRTVENNPEIRMAELEAEAGSLGADLAKRNYYPDLMLGVAPIQRDGRFDAFDVMLQVNLPIWRGKYNDREEEAAANARSMRSRAAAMKNVKGFEVKEAALMVESADRMRALYETALLPQVELSFESALRNYQAGKIDFLMLLDTERELKRTRIDYLKSLLEYRKKVALLERAAGSEISSANTEELK